MIDGIFHANHLPDGIVRMSSLVRRLRESRTFDTLAVLEKAWASTDQSCSVHGPLTDPVIGLVEPDQIAFGCPWCSGEDVFKAWEAEGAS